MKVILYSLFAAMAATAAEPEFLNVDFPAIRGANYISTRPGHHFEHWTGYDPKETERDLDYAKRINVNSVRIFPSRSAFLENPEAFRKSLTHFARACHERGISIMLVAMNKAELVDEPAPYPLTRAWFKELIEIVGNEPALICWDAFNEPDLPNNGDARVARIERAKANVEIFRELDTRRPRTPVTIGFATERSMEENADAVDVLSYHDYASTRDGIRRTIAAARACAEKYNKPLVNTEIGCTGRANPYDVAIEEYTDAHAGFYIWELMIAERWGDVHGVFYADGTVRDPSIAAAMLGFYRKRSADVVLENPDREGWVTRTVRNGRNWLGEADGSYERGLELAEQAANLLEANQLAAMHELPTRRVGLLREKAPDPVALKELLAGMLDRLEPYQRGSGGTNQ